jgi:hypothetical protein
MHGIKDPSWPGPFSLSLADSSSCNSVWPGDCHVLLILLSLNIWFLCLQCTPSLSPLAVPNGSFFFFSCLRWYPWWEGSLCRFSQMGSRLPSSVQACSLTTWWLPWSETQGIVFAWYWKCLFFFFFFLISYLCIFIFIFFSFYFLFFFPFFIRYLTHLHFQCYTKSPPYPPTPTPLPTHSPFLALVFPCTGAYKVCKSNGPLFPVMAD